MLDWYSHHFSEREREREQAFQQADDGLAIRGLLQRIWESHIRIVWNSMETLYCLQISELALVSWTVSDLTLIWFDLQLNFKVHITKTCNLSFYSLHKIRCTRKYLSYKSAQTLILALVIGCLDYHNSLLYGSPASYTNKLQWVQNAATRLIFNTTHFDHISPILIYLHWLPVKYCRMSKLAVYTFKAIHSSAPSYIHQLIRLKL